MRVISEGKHPKDFYIGKYAVCLDCGSEVVFGPEDGPMVMLERGQHDDDYWMIQWPCPVCRKNNADTATTVKAVSSQPVPDFGPTRRQPPGRHPEDTRRPCDLY